jgi:hypothetical protein
MIPNRKIKYKSMHQHKIEECNNMNATSNLLII